MGFLVKYFGEDKMACRYLTSTFLGCIQAEDLMEKFEEGTQDLEMKKMVKISMDGPNFYLKLYESITEKRNETEHYPALIMQSTCGA